MTRSLLLLLLMAAASAGEPALWSRTVAAQDADAALAAARAAAALRAALGGLRPRAVVFLDYRGEAKPGAARAVGDALRTALGGDAPVLAADAPILGTAGTAQPGYALAWGAGDRLSGSLVVTAFGGDGLHVGWAALGDADQRDYDKDPLAADRVRALRGVVAGHGATLVARLPAVPAGAAGEAVVLFGASHNDWHVALADGLRRALPERSAFVGGVGQFGDEIYADGRPLTRADGGAAAGDDGVVALRIAGRIAWAGDVERVIDGEDGPAQRAQLGDLLRAARARLPAPPALTVLMTTIGLSRGAGLDRAARVDAEMRAACGGGGLLGAALGGEAGLTADGRLHAGGGRIAALLLAPLPE